MAGMLLSMAFTLFVIAHCTRQLEGFADHLDDVAERKRLAEREPEVHRRGSCCKPRLHVPDEQATLEKIHELLS